jgi:hypothetical protein
MQNLQKLTFIDGTFSPEESREVLMNVYSSKINFHQIKNFSSRERFGMDDKTSTKRIPELKQAMEEFLTIIETAKKSGGQLEIKSDICISLIKSDTKVSGEALQA